MVLKLIQASVRCVGCHEYAETPLVYGSWIFFEVLWGNKWLQDK